MASTAATTAETSNLFAIDAELEAQFDAATQEQEETGQYQRGNQAAVSGSLLRVRKKVDRIALYVRATEFKARLAKKEIMRLTVRQKSTEKRVEQVKSMLAFFMRVRGLKRLDGELNTIRLRKNGQSSLQVDPLALAAEYNQVTISLAQSDWARVLDTIASPELKK